MPTSRSDAVNHPAHYNQYSREVIDLTSRLDFVLGNAVKYVLRAPHKGALVQDLQKALWYIAFYEARGIHVPFSPEMQQMSLQFAEDLASIGETRLGVALLAISRGAFGTARDEITRRIEGGQNATKTETN